MIDPTTPELDESALASLTEDRAFDRLTYGRTASGLYYFHQKGRSWTTVPKSERPLPSAQEVQVVHRRSENGNQGPEWALFRVWPHEAYQTEKEISEGSPSAFIERLTDDEEYRNQALRGETWWAMAQEAYLSHHREMFRSVGTEGEAPGRHDYTEIGWGIRVCKVFWERLKVDAKNAAENGEWLSETSVQLAKSNTRWVQDMAEDELP